MRSFKTYIRPYRNGFRALTVFVLLVLAVFCFINFPTSASKPGLRSSANFDLASIDGDDKLQMSVINAALAEARLLDFHAPTRNLLISWDKPARLELFSAANHTELVSSGLFSRSGDPKSIAVARGKNSSFAPGEMFLGFDRGLIFRISTDASEISEIKLPQETAAVVGLVTGETNAFDGDLIAITDTGKIWRIEGSGNTELLATLGTSLRGVTIIPDNIERYGRLARKLLVGTAEQQGIYAVDAGGQIDFISLGVKVRDIDPVSPDEHLFAISTRSGKLFTASADKFAGREGSILVTAADSSAYYVVDWNGADFKTSAIDIGEEIDQTVFAPISLRDDAGGCVTSLQLPENVFEWEGGNGSFSVSAPVNCSWTATSNAPWLSLLSGQSGMGNGTVTYFVARNGRSTLREANVAVGTLTHRVRQSRKAQLQCILGFDPSSPTIPAIGGSGTINVTGNDECAWQAVSDSPWLTITSNPFGRGNGSINFTVATNFGAQSRTAAINFGRQNGGLAVTQDPNLAPLVNAGPNQTIALPNTAVLSGTATDDGVGNPVTVSWSKLSGPETVIFSGSNNLTNTAIFAKEGVYVLRLTASDGFLSASDDVQITVNPDPIPPPPDPSTTAPPINPTVATNPFDATKFLYTGPNAIQTGVAPGTIKEDRVAIFRGRVISKSASPIPKVKITILDHPELGQTLTRADGMFDIVVNGGGELNVRYEKLGFMPVQREERSDWQEYDSVEDVVMIPHDGNVTFIDLSSNTPIQVAQSGLITDTSGTRRSRLFFKQGTTATMRLPGGGTQPLTMMNVRSTEFTVGANGPETMPGDLPALSAYTYASGYTVDEAVALNATEVTFNQPVIQYNENFLNFPVGTNVPSGVFDEASGIWLPSANGRVVKILSITSGIANLDLNGSGNPATDPEYSALGINTAEREQLATLYAANQSLWRVPVIHFSSWDSNWPYGPPSGAEPPGGDPPQCDTCLDDDCEGAGCVIGFGNQTLGEEIKITGTPYFMRYSSERQKGRISNRSLTIALSGATVPASLKRIDLVVSVGGRVFEQSFPNQPNQITNFQWDGLDAYGRVMQGRQLAKIDIGYVYDGVYQNAGQFGYNGNGIPITGSTTRGEITLHQVHRSYVGNLDSRALGLGGWTLDAHHFYDPSERVLYEGNGTRRSVQTISNGINTFGGGVSGYDGDGGHVSQAQFRWPYGIGFTPDGTIYVADSGNSRIRKIATDGVVTTFAGNGGGCSPSNFPCGEGGLAINASIGNVNRVLGAPDGNVYIGGGRNLWRVTTDGIFRRVAGLALDGFSGDGGPARDAQISNATRFYPTPDGSVYLSDMLNQRIRRIDPNGIITTIAGNGTIGFSGDGGPATQAQLNFPGDIVAAPDGNVYFIDQDNNRIRRISPDGIISTYAGTGVFGVSPDGLDRLATHFVFRAANQIESGSMTIGPDGSLYVVSYANVTGGRVRRIKPDGIVEGIAGVNDQTAGFSGDGGPALQARMRLAAIGLAPDGVIYATGGFSFDFDESRIRRISPPLPNFNGTHIAIPSEDGRQLFQFDAQGRHLGTTDTLTNAPLFTFSYDSTGRLTTVVDGDNNTTTIERDGTGNPTGIRSPYDQLTTFTRDANGYLATITNPNNEAHQFTYSAGGLMLTERDPRNNLSTFTYNALGQLIRDDDPATGFQTLTRNDAGVNFTVTHDTSLNRQTAFQVNNLSNGDRQRINILPDATQTSLLERGNGSDMLSDSDGTIINETTGGDPRWRLQAPITTNTTIATPGALNFNATFARAATLGTPGDPLSLISQTDTFNINGRTYTSVFTTSNRTFALTTPQNRQASRVIDTQGRLTQSQFADLNAGNYSYDTRGRLSIAAFGSGASARTYNLAYNPAGFLSSFTNPLNQTTNLTYDLAGRETQRTLPDGRNIAFGYDAKGNLTSLTPPGRPAHTFTYTPIDLVASYTAPNVGGNSTTTYAYNLDRQITSITRPDTLQITFGYNTAGRLQTLTVPTGSYGFAYNATTGLLSSITAPGGGVVVYQYDGFLSTRQTWTGTVAGNVSRTFDNNFRVASESINGANTVNFTYDNDNFLTGAGSLALTRNALNGLLTGSTLSNVNDTFTYNGFAEATNYNAKFNTTTLYDVNYTYDKLGRVTQKVETIGGTATTYAYGYDGTGRLTTVTLNGAPQPLVTYGYDTNNNRTSINVGGSVTTATYDAQDRLTQYGTTTYGYTLNGELQSKTAGGQTTQYSYDVLGNLRNVTLPDTTAIEYVIDGQDRRIGKRINGTLTQGFLYQDQLEPVAELDGSNNIVSRFVYGTRRNTPDYMIRGGVTYRIISDHIGSVRLVVDVATGNIAQRIDYDEFGVILNDTNPGFQPFGFAGGIYDTQTRLTRFGVRDYDAETGRWTAKDPIRFRGRNTNLYSYAFADPINFVDPDGAKPNSCPGGGPGGGPGGPNGPGGSGPGGPGGGGPSGGGSGGGSGGPGGGSGGSGGSGSGSGGGSGGNVINQTISGTLGLILSGLTNGGNASYGEPSTIPGDSNTLNQTYDPVPAPLPPGSSGGV